jgi:hypothetical protein
MKPTITMHAPDGSRSLWRPTTMDQIGRCEKDLEAVLAETPALLCLESKRGGVYGPYAIFSQLEFATPLSRGVIPDLVLLAASGDVVIVEVKLFANPELRTRSVIAQAIDYASSLSALSEADTVKLFSGGAASDWVAFVHDRFPDEEDPEELAAAFLGNSKDGNVHIVVACDNVPAGLYEVARSVSAQSHLSFSLDVVEVTPFVPKDGLADAVMYVPNVRLSTEIVARTAVSVAIEAGSPQPGVTIETTSVEEIEENLASAAQGRTRQTRARTWTDQEIEDVFLASDDPTVRDLFLFAKAEGFQGRFQSGGPKVSPAFGFYLRVRRPNGTEGGSQVFNCVGDGGNAIMVYVNNWPAAAVTPEDLDAFKADLRALCGSAVNVDLKDVRIATPLLADKVDAFKEVIRKMQRRIDAHTPAA